MPRGLTAISCSSSPSAGVSPATRSAITSRTLSGIAASAGEDCPATPSWSSMCRHTSPTRNAFPSVSPTSCCGELAVRTRAESPLRCTSSWTSATLEPAQADPHDALQPVQLRQRRSERLRQLAIALAEQRQHDDRSRAQRPRKVTQEEQRRCVGPLHVIEHEHRRRLAGEPRQQRRQRCVQLVALGIGVLRLRIGVRGRRVAGSRAQAWQQAAQRRRVAAGARLGLIGLELREDRLERLDERLVGRADRGVAGAVEHAHPARGDVLGELPRQPRLAAARLATHQGDLPPVGARPVGERERAAPAPRPVPRTASRAEAVAGPEAMEARRAGLRGIGSSLCASSEGSWRRIAASRRRSSGDGLEAELLVQPSPAARVDLQRVGLAPAAIEGQHEQAEEPFARGMLGSQLLELGDDERVLPRRQARVEALFQGGEAQLLEPCDLSLRERLERDIGECRAPPQPERFVEQPPRRGFLAREARRPRRPHERLETPRVDRFGLDREAISPDVTVSSADPPARVSAGGATPSPEGFASRPRGRPAARARQPRTRPTPAVGPAGPTASTTPAACPRGRRPRPRPPAARSTPRIAICKPIVINPTPLTSACERYARAVQARPATVRSAQVTSPKETTVTLHTIPAVSGHRRPRLALAATLAAVTCAGSGAITIGSSGEQPFAQLASFTDSGSRRTAPTTSKPTRRTACAHSAATSTSSGRTASRGSTTSRQTRPIACAQVEIVSALSGST